MSRRQTLLRLVFVSALAALLELSGGAWAQPKQPPSKPLDDAEGGLSKTPPIAPAALAGATAEAAKPSSAKSSSSGASSTNSSAAVTPQSVLSAATKEQAIPEPEPAHADDTLPASEPAPSSALPRAEILKSVRAELANLRYQAQLNWVHSEHLRVQVEKLNKILEALLAAEQLNGEPVPSTSSTALRPRPPQLRFIHLWATHCTPCLAELSEIIKLAKELQGHHVVIQLIAEELSSDPRKAAQVFVSNGGSPGMLKVIHGYQDAVRKDYKIPTGTQPATILTCNGQSLFQRIGRLSLENRQSIQRAVTATLQAKACRNN